MSTKAKSFSEKIIPLSANDQPKPVSNIRTLVFIVVRDVLDGDFMKASLDKLIRTHIPLLGARMKPSGPDGWLQYHSILPFPDKYEIFRWSVSNVSSTLGEANIVPEQNSQNGITILPDVTVSERWWTPADWPIVISDEKPNTPLLLVHLTYYTDATVMTLSLPHSAIDQMGYGSIISSWIDVMKGKEPPPFIELPEGALAGDNNISKKELHKKYAYRLKTKAERAEVLMGLVPELIIRPKETRCIFYIPVETVNGLRDRWRRELKEDHGSETVDITNGDVLVGILAKFANMHRKKPKKQCITGPANLRGIHPSLPKDQHYLHNALVFCVSRAAISRSQPPASELAYGNRLAILDGIKPANIERNLAVTRELATRKIGMHICEPWEFSYSTTNWCKAWHGIDFSVASIKKNVDIDSSSEDNVKSIDRAASAPIIFGHSLERNHPIRFGAVVMSKAEGGYWIDFAAPDEGMAAIKALLEKDPNLETI